MFKKKFVNHVFLYQENFSNYSRIHLLRILINQLLINFTCCNMKIDYISMRKREGERLNVAVILQQ